MESGPVCRFMRTTESSGISELLDERKQLVPELIKIDVFSQKLNSHAHDDGVIGLLQRDKLRRKLA